MAENKTAGLNPERRYVYEGWLQHSSAIKAMMAKDVLALDDALKAALEDLEHKQPELDLSQAGVDEILQTKGGQETEEDIRGKLIAENLGEAMRKGFDPSALEPETNYDPYCNCTSAQCPHSEKPNPEPEPDHEAARKDAELIATKQNQGWNTSLGWKQIGNITRAYLAQAATIDAILDHLHRGCAAARQPPR